MRRAVVIGAVLAALAACGPDSVPFEIQFSLERDSDNLRCPTDSCTNIAMGCDVAVMLRIVHADDPTEVYLDRCERIEGGVGRDLCALREIDLGAAVVPNTRVSIEVAVWPVGDEEVAECPDIEFTADGEPVLASPAPALGGRRYFAVGSADVAEVELGCINAPSLVDACVADGAVSIRATVDDFRTNVSVAPTDRITVTAGEPRYDADVMEYVLDVDDVVELERTVVSPVPQWQGELTDVEAATCIQVIEQNVAQATATLRCVDVAPEVDELALEGTLVEADIIDAIENALGDLPSGGLVLGRVRDNDGVPAAGVTVTPSDVSVTVRYLSEDLGMLVDGTVTTSSGVFVAVPVEGVAAPFDVHWTAALGEIDEVAPVLGGFVRGKVTVVPLELDAPSNQP